MSHCFPTIGCLLWSLCWERPSSVSVPPQMNIFLEEILTWSNLDGVAAMLCLWCNHRGTRLDTQSLLLVSRLDSLKTSVSGNQQTCYDAWIEENTLFHVLQVVGCKSYFTSPGGGLQIPFYSEHDCFLSPKAVSALLLKVIWEAACTGPSRASWPRVVTPLWAGTDRLEQLLLYLW